MGHHRLGQSQLGGREMSLPTSSIEVVTPDMARGYMEHNSGNRKIRVSQVDYFSRELRAGRLRTTHQGVAFSCNGRLLDGQHRLLAIIETGISATMFVTRGLSEDAYNSIDFGGVARNMADVIRIERHLVEPVTFLYKVIHGLQKVDPEEFRPYIYSFLKQSELLRVYSSITRRGFTTQPIKAAVILRSNETGDDYALKVYCDFAAQNWTELPPIAGAFANQVMFGVGGGSKHRANRRLAHLETFLRALRAFDPKHAKAGTVVITDPAKALADARKRILAQLPTDH